MNQESMDSATKLNEREIRLKTDEIQKLRTELDSLKKHLNEKDKFEKELLSNHQLNSNEVRNMKNEIKNLNEHINQLNSDRESMTIAHQFQIIQLKESFNERFRTNENWQEKLNTDLAKSREKHYEELQKQEQRLRENFRIEMEIQQQKYNEMYSKYQQLSRDHGESARLKISALELEKQRLLGELKNLHEEKVNSEKKSRKELDNLRAITKELHEQLEKYTNENSSSNSSKQNIMQKENLLKEHDREKKIFETQISHLKEEIKVLQETVHNECMERQELLEKLDETREELLNLKKQTYSSTDKLLPLKQSISLNNNLASKKLETPDKSNNIIDLSYDSHSRNEDEFLKLKSSNSNYTRYLSEIETHTNSNKLRTSQLSTSMIESARRNSFSGASGSNGDVSKRSETNSAESKKALSTNSEHFSPQKLHALRREAVFHQLNSEKNGLPTAPIQLFKKINQISSSSQFKPPPPSNVSKNKRNSMADNKKRISLLIARK